MSGHKINELIALEGIAGDGIEPFVMVRHSSVFAPTAKPMRPPPLREDATDSDRAFHEWGVAQYEKAIATYDDTKDGVITAPLRRHEAIAMRDWLSTWIDLSATNETPPPPDATLDLDALNAQLETQRARREADEIAKAERYATEVDEDG